MVETDIAKVVSAVRDAKGVVRRPVGGGLQKVTGRTRGSSGGLTGDGGGAVWTGR